MYVGSSVGVVSDVGDGSSCGVILVEVIVGCSDVEVDGLGGKWGDGFIFGVVVGG